jgi:hypothetical protein
LTPNERLGRNNFVLDVAVAIATHDLLHLTPRRRLIVAARAAGYEQGMALDFFCTYWGLYVGSSEGDVPCRRSHHAIIDRSREKSHDVIEIRLVPPPAQTLLDSIIASFTFLTFHLSPMPIQLQHYYCLPKPILTKA